MPQDRTRLAIVSSHPIQYQVPWFRALAARPEIELTVFFAVIPDAEDQGVGFGVPLDWDIPMLEGYPWRRLPSARRRPSIRGFFSSRSKGLGRVLRDHRPDVAVITGWHCYALIQALVACKRLGVSSVVRGESNALRERSWWRRLPQRLLIHRYDHFLAIGRANAALYRGHGVAPGDISPCPYFVDNDRLSQAATTFSSRRRALRESWSVPEGATCFLFAGKLVEKKRPLDLLAAVGRAQDSDAPLHLLVVGDGALRAECERVAKRDRLPVTFAGFLNQSEIARAYVACDCLVLPSDYGETWGLVVNEAMACGKPAIVSDRVGCGPDLVEPGVTGFVFPFGDVEALADTLVAAAADRETLTEMGERGRALVLENYSVERAVEGTLEAVEAVLARAR